MLSSEGDCHQRYRAKRSRQRRIGHCGNVTVWVAAGSIERSDTKPGLTLRRKALANAMLMKGIKPDARNGFLSSGLLCAVVVWVDQRAALPPECMRITGLARQQAGHPDCARIACFNLTRGGPSQIQRSIRDAAGVDELHAIQRAHGPIMTDHAVPAWRPVRGRGRERRGSFPPQGGSRRAPALRRGNARPSRDRRDQHRQRP